LINIISYFEKLKYQLSLVSLTALQLPADVDVIVPNAEPNFIFQISDKRASLLLEGIEESWIGVGVVNISVFNEKSCLEGKSAGIEDSPTA